MITAKNVTDELITALRDEARAVGEQERVRCCNAALGLATGDGALGVLDTATCRARVAAILENSRQCGTLHHYGADPTEYADDEPDNECLGHPAGAFDPMGQTVYCDGSCRARTAPRALADWSVD